jgi:heme/copper-type cytochrome/quinol oxidase subunit 2
MAAARYLLWFGITALVLAVLLTVFIVFSRRKEQEKDAHVPSRVYWMWVTVASLAFASGFSFFLLLRWQLAAILERRAVGREPAPHQSG